MGWTISIISYIIVAVLLLVGIIIVVKKNCGQEPIDDSKWNFDMSNMNAKLQKFVSGKEKIIAVLGINNIAELMMKGIDSHGFCLLTDNAFYFIGKIVHRKSGFTRGNSVQRRINVESYRAISARQRIEYKLVLLFLIAFIHVGLSLSKVYELLFIIGGDAELISIPYVIVAIVSLLEAIFCIANVKVSKSVVVEIEFATEKYIFDVNQLGKQEIKIFYHQLSSLDAKANI